MTVIQDNEAAVLLSVITLDYRRCLLSLYSFPEYVGFDREGMIAKLDAYLLKQELHELCPPPPPEHFPQVQAY